MAASKTISIGVVFFVLALFSVHCAGGRRGASEHQVRQLRPTRGFKEMELAAARNFGKRAVIPVNMHLVNSILMEWLALERKMKNLRQRSNLPLPLESERSLSALAEVPDENAPGDDVLLDE